MNRMKYLVGAAAVMTLVVVSACGKSSSPTSPSSSPNAGAVINGIVSGMASGSAAGYGKLDTGTGITVTINGTNLTVPVDASGKFVFTGVPAGTVQLVITVSGVPTTITLEGVKETDKIVVKITIKGTTAALDTEERNGTEVTELEDRITVVKPGDAARTLMVGAVKVLVPEAAVIRHGGSTVTFDTLKVGDRVHVRGTMAADLFTATEVKVQNTNENVAVNASGKLAAAATGSCPELAFAVGGWNVVTNTNTDFGKDGCKPLAAGTTVHVKGDVQSTGKVLATWVQAK